MDLNVIDLKNIVAKRLYFWVILCKSVIFVPAKYLCGFAKNRMKNIFLGHLSAENNTPDLAYSTVTEILKKSGISAGKDVNITLAQRHCPSGIVTFGI